MYLLLSITQNPKQTSYSLGLLSEFPPVTGTQSGAWHFAPSNNSVTAH